MLLINATDPEKWDSVIDRSSATCATYLNRQHSCENGKSLCPRGREIACLKQAPTVARHVNLTLCAGPEFALERKDFVIDSRELADDI